LTIGIQIKPLKRKKPEPKIPFIRTQPFFNQNSEPNIELLTSAIDISLKRFKRIEEEALIFPSDVDAEARDLEEKFGEALKLLRGYVKNKIKGRGMETLSQVMDFAAQSHAPWLTSYNHEEERLLSEQVFASVHEDVLKAFEEAERIASEEAEARELARQEALKVAVEIAARITKVEIEKMAEEQAMEHTQDQDTIMAYQDTPA
jgi:electron transfer flavoprotein alpha subunit